MRHALVLAARGLGRVAPNPSVGCVIVDASGHVVGRGSTAPGGRPHAETLALDAAGTRAKGATAYVSLEPCAHHGVTPPCAGALIKAGVARVVGACTDPDPRVAGKGFEMLRAAGIAVTEGVLESQARALNAGFFLRVTQYRPLVALKSAESADGYVAGPSGAPRWITGELARRHAHHLRAKYDAILVGIGTVLADDPLLTCRLPGLEDRSPLRVVLDSKLRLPPRSQLVRTARTTPLLVMTSARSGGDELVAAGATIIRLEAGERGLMDLKSVLSSLASRGLTRLLVEGGAMTHAAFLTANLVDELHIYRAPLKLGGGLRSGIGVSDTKFRLVSREAFFPDVLESYEARG
jgi:diaminohydroxyphosphoribosylaminopyrimidine deaminase/5-amino-6-(5-phosphoribosylamino)uracil reductase